MPTSKKHLWLIWTLIIIFYFYQYFLRVFPVVLTEELLRYFRIDASALGFFSASYFLIYALLQIPVGILIDRFGSKKILPAACFICGLGTLCFAGTEQMFLANLGRILQGLGSSFAFIGMIYVSAHYFPITMLGFLVCLGDSLGRLGAVFASGPYAELITFISWKVSLFWIGLFGLLISAALYFALPTSPVASETQTHVIDVLKTLLKEKSMWLICCVSSFLVVFTTAFAGLWGVPFLEAAYRMSKTTASFAISVFFLGAILGSPSIGYISDRLMRRKPFLMFAGFFGTLLTLLLVYTPIFSSLGVYFLLFLLGILTSIQNLTYCVAIENNQPKFKGVISGYVNLFVFLIGATSQPLVGYLLERHSTLIFQSSSMYTFKDYQFSFWCFPLFFFLSFILSILISDKKKV